MRYRNFLAGLVGAVAAMGFGVSVQAAPLLNMSFTLLDSGGTAVPVDGSFHNGINQTTAGVYVINPGTVYRLRVLATETNPQSTDANHTDANTGDPLDPIQIGIQNLTFNILSNGIGGLLNPLDTNPSSGHWALTGTSAVLASKGAQPTAANYAFTNLVDQGSDGDLDPTSTGYQTSNLVWDNAAGSASAGGVVNGLGTLTTVITGGYLASNTVVGTNTMSFGLGTANYFDDPAAADNSLTAVAFDPNNITLGTISISILAPEPASIGLLGLGCLSLLGSRRRRVA